VLAGFAGIFLIAAGFALLAPLVTLSFLRLAGPLTGRAFGVLGRMAPRSVTRSLSRTAVAIAALMMAVSVTLGVGLMVGSFRATVVDWLGQTLDGDIYISAPSFLATRPSNPLDPDVIDVAAGWPGVSGVQKVRSSSVLSPAGPIAISAVSAPDITGNRIYISTDAGPAGLGAAVKAGAVLVSEPLANRLRLPAHGASISLATEHGPHSFPVAGIYRDYTSSQGVVTLDAGTYHSYWDDPVWTSVSLTLAPGVDAGRVAAALQAALNRRQAVVVQTNSRLRADVLQVFDRAFAITDALQLLAAAVAFIGVLSALLALQLERARETGVLRAIGLTARQLFGAVLLETGLMGTVAGLLAWPSGLAMALVLSYIINRRSFGWTLEFHAAPGIFLQALLLAVAAALLAGIYPAWRMARAVIAEAVRGE
jgi:putative ABC transport system permease protein